MRVDVTQRPVGSFYGGKPSAATSDGAVDSVLTEIRFDLERGAHRR